MGTLSIWVLRKLCVNLYVYSVRDILDKVVNKLIDKVKIGRKSDEVYVTDLSRCAYYVYWFYNEAKPEEVYSMNLVEGTLMHALVEKVVNSLVRDGEISMSDASTEVEVSTVYDGYVISGRVDLIIRGEAIVEFKFTHNPKYIFNSNGLLNLWHVAQINLYMYLTGIRRGYLVYFYTPTLQYRVINVKYIDSLVKDRLSKIGIITKAKKGTVNNLEELKEKFGCQFCPIARRCLVSKLL